MQLSKRLTALAALVTTGNRLADVGTDHGYVPISLIMQNRIPSAIAMDINEGPLLRAREHIRQYGCEAYIETRLSDGLEALKPGEADTVLIAGMGGALMQRILEEGGPVLTADTELILQPQSELREFRRYLNENGYRIIGESMVLEDGKYYPMMKVLPGTAGTDSDPEAAAQPYTETELCFGKVSLQQNREVLLSCLEKSLSVQEQILESLKKAGGPRKDARREEVCHTMDLLLDCRAQLLERQHPFPETDRE